MCLILKSGNLKTNSQIEKKKNVIFLLYFCLTLVFFYINYIKIYLYKKKGVSMERKKETLKEGRVGMLVHISPGLRAKFKIKCAEHEITMGKKVQVLIETFLRNNR